MLHKRSVNHGSLPHNKPIRAAIVRRKLKGSVRGLQSTARPSSNSRGADEDSGFGGDSGAELSMESGAFAHSSSSLSSHHEAPSSSSSSSSSCTGICDASLGTSSSGTNGSFGTGNSSTNGSFGTGGSGTSSSGISISGTGSNFSRIVLPRFGAKEEFFVDPSIDIHPKRLRLDMTEEANELPEEEASPPQCPEGGAKIVSFKNVPGLIFPANAVQVQPATLLSISPQQPKQVVVEHLKQKIIATCKLSSKVEKVTKKKAKCHVLEGNLFSASSDGSYELQLLTQPEGQHRARYQTEGSRGAVKDRAGTGHPTVKLKGYDKDAVLQVFVASDGAQGGSVTPHLFYQACKVSGKNSTPCTEERVHGTTVLEIAMQPDTGMTVSCDCVGILKERNVDVEQRMKSFVTRGKKKSTKCRLVFRTKVTLASGTQELLQVVSQPISCTQPPGLPEICRKSRSSCLVEGNEEMFIIGKNFYKDTEVVFREMNDKDEILWTSTVVPEKDFLQSNHLICQIPSYCNMSLSSELEVQVVVVSCNKVSDPHPFTYLPRKKEIKEEKNAVRLQAFPKAVSPSTAVKLNELFLESGSELSQSKEYLHLGNSSLTTTTSPLPVNGNNALSMIRERAVIPPVQVNRVLAAVKPQMQAIGITNPKFTQKNIHCNTFTTATVLPPKQSPNSVPSLSPDPVGGTLVKERENVLENLIQMLRLVKNIPGSLHNPILELVADEILRQVKKGEGIGVSVVEKSNPVQSSIILSNTDSSFLYGMKTTTHEKTSNVKEMTFVAPSTNTSGNSTKVYPLNTFHTLPNAAESTTSTHAFMPVSIQTDKPPQGGSTKVVYPIGTNFFSAREIFGVSQSDTPVVQAMCQSNPLVINVTEHQPVSVLPNKIDYLTPINSSEIIPSERDAVLKKMDHNAEPITTLPNNYKVINMQGHNSTLSFNPGEMKGEGNLLQNGRTVISNTGKELSLQDATYVLESPVSSRNLDMALTFKLENSDPLLSQASAMTLPPVGEHHSPEGAASMISQTINQGGANDVHISNFSESELLDYINPTCFDNV